MPDINPIIAFILETGGAWALLLLFMGYVAWSLNKRLLEAEKRNADLQKEAASHINGLYEKRIGEMERTNAAIAEFEETLKANVAGQGEVANFLRQVAKTAHEQANDIKANTNEIKSLIYNGRLK